MKLDEIFDPTMDAPAFKFTEIGDSVAGLIVREPQWAADKFNADEKVLVVLLDTDNGFQRIFCRKPQQRAVGRALKSAGTDEMTVAGWLKLTYAADKELDNGRTARDWQAEYKPARGVDAIGVGELGETGDVFGAVFGDNGAQGA